MNNLTQRKKADAKKKLNEIKNEKNNEHFFLKESWRKGNKGTFDCDASTDDLPTMSP